MFYLVYKITNNINDRFYIGMHKTNIIDDGYMGSGKLIKQAIKKYGIANFSKEILHIFDNYEDMKNKEKELVVLSEQSYNLCEGGKGGFSYLNNSGIAKFHGKKHTDATKKIISEKAKGRQPSLGKDPWNKGKTGLYSEDHLNKLRKPRSEETKRKISESLKKRNAERISST